MSTPTSSSNACDPMSTSLSEREQQQRRDDQGDENSTVRLRTFCIPLQSSQSPSSEVRANEGASLLHGGGEGGLCVVGTVTVLKSSSAMIWIGWGQAKEYGHDGSGDDYGSSGVAVGSGQTSTRPIRTSLPPMGPLAVSMPRTQYKGMSSMCGKEQGPSSQLLGGESEDDQMISWQMSSRMAKKIGWPIFVSSSLSICTGGVAPATAAIAGLGNDGSSSNMHDALGGLDSTVAARRAAALAEKEVTRMLLRIKEDSSL